MQAKLSDIAARKCCPNAGIAASEIDDVGCDRISTFDHFVVRSFDFCCSSDKQIDGLPRRLDGSRSQRERHSEGSGEHHGSSDVSAFQAPG